MNTLELPDQLQQLADGESFSFRCHPGVACFTECCRELELALSPYDVLRLTKALGLTSQEFLDRHAVIEYTEEDRYPQVYLGMVDDGRASCPFVGPQGCLVYRDRPGACRTYPLGRAAQPGADGSITELFVLLREPHCQGFADDRRQTVAEWGADQGWGAFNRFSDQWLQSLTDLGLSERRLTPAQVDTFILALYNLDSFRAALLAQPPQMAKSTVALDPTGSDEELLASGMRWLRHELFRA